MTASKPEGAVGNMVETDVQPSVASGEKESSVQPRVVHGIVFSRIPGHEHLHFLSARASLGVVCEYALRWLR